MHQLTECRADAVFQEAEIGYAAMRMVRFDTWGFCFILSPHMGQCFLTTFDHIPKPGKQREDTMLHTCGVCYSGVDANQAAPAI